MNANTQEVILSSVADFLESNNARLIKWVLVPTALLRILFPAVVWHSTKDDCLHYRLQRQAHKKH